MQVRAGPGSRRVHGSRWSDPRRSGSRKSRLRDEQVRAGQVRVGQVREAPGPLQLRSALVRFANGSRLFPEYELIAAEDGLDGINNRPIISAETKPRKRSWKRVK